MPVIDVDLSDTGSNALPAGEYPVRVETADIRTSRTSGTPYLAMRLKVQAGEYRGRYINEHIHLWALDPLWARKKFSALRGACGLDPTCGGSTEDLPGHSVLAVVSVTHDGTNSVQTYRPWTPPQRQQADQVVRYPC